MEASEEAAVETEVASEEVAVETEVASEAASAVEAPRVKDLNPEEACGVVLE